MLLPSALPCDVRRSSRFTPTRLFATPPPSDTGFPGNGLRGTCRALQSLLNGSPSPPSRKTKRLQSPLPITPRRSPRSQKAARPVSPRQTPPPRAAALTPPPPPSAPSRGANKRFRDVEDECDAQLSRNLFSTPKRRRHIPSELPRGLAPTDFYALHSPPVTQSPPSPARRMAFDFGPAIDPDAPLPSIEVTEELPVPGTWSTEEDQHLIKLVLDKIKLSQRDWDECARQMGRAGAGDRWQSLVAQIVSV
ncbi:unnamed protein product [Penicillium bialowiezense]